MFAGGIANVLADEWTHRGDILMFSGLAGAESARVTFGLRNTMQFFSRGTALPDSCCGSARPTPYRPGAGVHGPSRDGSRWIDCGPSASPGGLYR